MVSDAGAAVLVSKTDLLAQLALPSNACKVLLDADGPAIAREPKSARRSTCTRTTPPM